MIQFFRSSQATKQPQIITLPPPCLTVWCFFFFLKCSVSFTPDIMGWTPSNKIHFFLFSPQNIFQKAFWDYQNVLGRASVFYLVSGQFFNSLSFLIVETWTLTLSGALGLCYFLNVILNPPGWLVLLELICLASHP